MPVYQCRSPILLLIYNRPELTRRIFREVKRAQPSLLFIAADGPAGDLGDDKALCEKTRAVTRATDWNCEPQILFREEHLGCREAVSQAITWFFNHVERGIILEDDCLPDPSFFRFCDELLNRYARDERIGMISGNNFLCGKKSLKASYYFSRYSHIWGWATWKRAWQKYDAAMALWPLCRRSDCLRDVFGADTAAIRYWSRLFETIYQGKKDTWDAQWVFTCFINGYLSIMPHVNLIANIGFGNQATQTTDGNHPFADMQTRSVNFPLNHPDYILPDHVADKIDKKHWGFYRHWPF